MNPLRVVCVDDEQLALRRMALALAKVPGVSLAGAESDPYRALTMINRLRPDLLLLDITMPGMSGFELVDQLKPDQAPAVIFVTAYEAHAIRAFEVNAVDYLMKPVAVDRLRGAIYKARSILASRDNERHMLELQSTIARLRNADHVAGTAAAETQNPFLWIHQTGGYVRVPIAQILWFEAERDYVRVHTPDGRGLIRETMNNLVRRLDPTMFFRVHRSAIVAGARINGVRRKPTGALIVKIDGGMEIAVGRHYAKGLRDLLRQIG